MGGNGPTTVPVTTPGPTGQPNPETTAVEDNVTTQPSVPQTGGGEPSAGDLPFVSVDNNTRVREWRILN